AAVRDLLVLERTALGRPDPGMAVRARDRRAVRPDPRTTCARLSARSLSHAQVPAAHAHLPDLPPDAHGADAARALRISDLLDRWHHRSRHHDLDPLAPGADERPDLADSGGGDGYVEPEESVMTVGGQLANWPTGQLAGSRS